LNDGKYGSGSFLINHINYSTSNIALIDIKDFNFSSSALAISYRDSFAHLNAHYGCRVMRLIAIDYDIATIGNVLNYK
jgi:hypothetical protein